MKIEVQKREMVYESNLGTISFELTVLAKSTRASKFRRFCISLSFYDHVLLE